MCKPQGVWYARMCVTAYIGEYAPVYVCEHAYVILCVCVCVCERERPSPLTQGPVIESDRGISVSLCRQEAVAPPAKHSHPIFINTNLCSHTHTHTRQCITTQHKSLSISCPFCSVLLTLPLSLPSLPPFSPSLSVPSSQACVSVNGRLRYKDTVLLSAEIRSAGRRGTQPQPLRLSQRD